MFNFIFLLGTRQERTDGSSRNCDFNSAWLFRNKEKNYLLSFRLFVHKNCVCLALDLHFPLFD